ncbi:MAG: hypothetical protein ACI9RL_001616, partial [Candidatus Paceibacteria bacterium]
LIINGYLLDKAYPQIVYLQLFHFKNENSL